MPDDRRVTGNGEWHYSKLCRVSVSESSVSPARNYSGIFTAHYKARWHNPVERMTIPDSGTSQV